MKKNKVKAAEQCIKAAVSYLNDAAENGPERLLIVDTVNTLCSKLDNVENILKSFDDDINWGWSGKHKVETILEDDKVRNFMTSCNPYLDLLEAYED